MKKYRKGNAFENELINMKDIDLKFHGSESNEDHFKALKVVENKLESLLLTIERSRIREYMILTDSKRRLFTINFISGVGKGFGQAIGFSVLTAFAVYLVSKWVNLPIIGQYIAEFLDIVDRCRQK